jgi:hypothetical protein
VALLTELFRQLGQLKPQLKPTVLGVFIANEENSTVSALHFCASQQQRATGVQQLWLTHVHVAVLWLITCISLCFCYM